MNVGAAAREPRRARPRPRSWMSRWQPAVRAEHGPADLVVANNVYAHIPDLLGFTRSLRELLADDGWLSIEVHHALNLVRLGQFDTIYHEHFQYYTLLSATRGARDRGSGGRRCGTVFRPTAARSGSGHGPEGVAGPPRRVAEVLRPRRRPACTTSPAT